MPYKFTMGAIPGLRWIWISILVLALAGCSLEQTRGGSPRQRSGGRFIGLRYRR